MSVKTDKTKRYNFSQPETMLILTYTTITFLLFQYVLTINGEDFSVTDLITNNGYPVEVHYVTTSDGYILKMHRISHGKNTTTAPKVPVLVLHGILLSSAVFVIGEVSQSLGFNLADDDYDVWLGNVRGNSESRNHTSLDPNGTKFWNFSWHEMGTEDLPAMIDYILEETDQKELFYIGHSQGTTVLYVLLTMRAEYNKKIKAHFSLAPIGYFAKKTNIILHILAKIATSGFVKLLHIHEFFSKDKGFASILYTVIFVGLLKQGSTNVKNTLFFVMAKYFPAGCSMKQVVHYAQEVNTGYFRRYDYGKKNTEVYGLSVPSSYNLSLITAPGYFFFGSEDNLVAEEAVDRLCKDIGDACVERYLIPKFRHMDYIINENAPDLVYSKIFNLMNKH